MSEKKKQNKEEFINPIDEDNITDTPSTIEYGHHRGSLPVAPTDEGQTKSKALSAMQHQTDMQLEQIKAQMALLANQAQKIQKRIDISASIYGAEMRFEPLINHTYHLYKKEGDKFILSMISPNQWGKNGCPYEFAATVRLLADHTWEVVE